MFGFLLLITFSTNVVAFQHFGWDPWDMFEHDLINDRACFGHTMQTREPCGEGFESEKDCRNAKCCWDETFEDAYRCFKPRKFNQNPRCSIDYRERLSCTKKIAKNRYYLPDRSDCLSFSCCFDPESPLSVMWTKIKEENTKNGKHLPLEKARSLYDELVKDFEKNPVPQCYMMQDVVDGRCAVPNEERKACKYSFNDTLENCVQSGCCYSDNIKGEMKCYERDYRYDTNEDCRISVDDSVILEEFEYSYDMLACERDGFCFQHPNTCFYSISKLAKFKEKKKQEEINRQRGIPIKSNEIHFNPSLMEQPKDDIEFCWASTYGRGVGLIPGDCDELEKQGLLCYPKCKENYIGVLFVCWQNCPEGFTDHGAFCFKPPPYGRGVGYPWKFGDALNDKAMFSRCEADRGKGNCEKWGLVVYPKCSKGYHNVGCCICSPDCKDGQVDIGISCAKKSYTRATILPTCEDNLEYDAGLCYKKCNKGFNGVGPVCWGSCPSNVPVRCGMACAIDHETCMNNLFDQVTSAIDVISTIASTIASAGSSLAAKTAIKTSAKMAAKTVMKKVSKLVSKEGAEKAMKIAMKEGGNVVQETAVEAVANNIGALASGKEDEWEWEEFDPTGIATLIKDYNHPICKYT